MKIKDKKKKKQKDKDELSFREIMRNNLWGLSLIRKFGKGYIAYRLISNMVLSILWFISDTYLLRYILNSFENKTAELSEVIFWIVLMVTVRIVHYFANYLISGFIMMKKRTNIRRRIREMLFHKALESDLESFERPEYYDKYVKAMDEATDRVFAVLESVQELTELVLMLLLNGALIASIDPILYIFAIFPILFGLLRKKELKVYYKYVADQKPIDRRKRYIRRTFYMNEYAKEMRLSSMPKSQIEIFRSLYGNYKKVLQKHGKKRTALGFFGEMTGTLISSVGSLFYAVFRTVVTGTMLIGDCAVTVNSVGQLDYYLNRSLGDLSAFAEHALYLRDMRAFLESTPTIKSLPNAPKAVPGRIEFRNVSFSYVGSEEKVLDSVSFAIAKDEVIALVGRNGAGKSTLVKLLLRLYDPTEGVITLNGRDIRKYDLESYRAMFCPMFQDYKSFSLTVAENVLRGSFDEKDRDTVMSALKSSGVYERITEMPKGIDTVLTKEFEEEGEVLSGGENQKIQLAAVFSSGCPYAILDEPSSALDPIAEEKVFRSMIEVTAGRSVMYISHRLSSALLADKILVLESGKLTEQGSHESLMAKGGFYKEMFERQAENYRCQGSEDGGNE